jgi:hypothetical protein
MLAAPSVLREKEDENIFIVHRYIRRLYIVLFLRDVCLLFSTVKDSEAGKGVEKNLKYKFLDVALRHKYCQVKIDSIGV